MIRELASCIALAGVLMVSVLFCFSSQQAHAAVAGLISPSIVGGLNQTVSTGGSTGYTAGARLGFGLAILEADVSAMYLSRGFDTGNIKYVQIPVMVRYSFIPMLSVGAGGFYDIALTSEASEVYGIRGAVLVSPVGLPLYGEASYSYNLGPVTSGGVKDFQLLAGFKF